MWRRVMWCDDPFCDFSEYSEEFIPKWICFGKGGGSPQPTAPTSQTVNQSNLPDYAQPFFTRLLERTEATSNTPYQAYTGQRLADTSADTSQSYNMIENMANNGVPQQVANATTAANNVANYAPSGPFTAQSAIGDSGTPGVSNIQAYMNPYVQNVLNVQTQMAQQKFAEDQAARDAAFVKNGAFSNARRDIATEQAQRDQNLQLQNIQAQGLSNAYQQAGTMFQSDADRALQAQIESEKSAQAAQQLNLGAAQQLGALGQEQQTLGLQQANALAATGALQEQKQQSGLDLAYTDFINQRDYPRQQLNFYSGILRGVPISAQSEVTQYQAPPNTLSQSLGLGLGGLSLYQQLMGGGSGG